METIARKVDVSGTFRDVGRQSAACDMACTACHATLTSTLRDTLQEKMLQRVTLRLDVTTRDGTSLKSLTELVNFLDLYESNTVAIPVDSYIVASSVFFFKKKQQQEMVREDHRMSPSDVVNSAYSGS